MPALAQCDAFAFIYDQAGDPAPDVLVVLKRVLDASGNPILLSPKTTVTDSAGSFHFTLPEFATAFISARASALWNCPDGLPFTVPSGPSGELVPGFSLTPSATVMPPLVYVSDVLSIPKASETQDGYLSAADFVRFEAGAAEMGITQIDTGTGLTGGPITDTGTISLALISGVAGMYSNPTSITVNAYGQVIAVTAAAPDTTPPVISALTVTNITGNGATVTWTTNEPADSQVEYGPTTSYGTSTTLDTSPVTSHSVTLTGLSSSSTYHYRAKSRDTASNLQTSGDSTLTTTAGPADTTPPVISGVGTASLAATSVNVQWTTNEASDSQVEYGPTTAYGTSSTLNPSPVTTHVVPLSGLTPNTPYHYRVKSRDVATNLATSGDFTFTTPVAADTTPPGISAETSSSVTATSVIITWTTNEPADSQVEYSIDPDVSYGSLTTITDTSPRVISHTVTLTGLTAATLYHYRVKSRDAALNVGTSPLDHTFMTSAAGGGVDLLNQLVSYWKMDEIGGSTTRADALGPNALGVNFGTVAGVTGIINSAVFVDSLGYLQAPHNSSQNFAGSMSIAGWINILNLTGGDGVHSLLTKCANVGPDIEFYLVYNNYAGGGGEWIFGVSNTGLPGGLVEATVSAAVPTINTWYHVAAVYDDVNHEIRLRINDGAVGSNTQPFTGPLCASTQGMSVGLFYYAAAYKGDAAVDELGLWNKALNAAEITALYGGGTPPAYPFP